MTEIPKNNKTLNIVIISNLKEAQKVLDDLNEKGYDTAQCSSCKAIIVNRTIERSPENIFERWLSRLFKVKFHMWDCNFGNPVHKEKKVVCNELSCFMIGQNKDG